MGYSIIPIVRAIFARSIIQRNTIMAITVDREDYDENELAILDKVVRFDLIEKGQYREGMMAFTLSSKQSAMSSSGRSGWMHEICTDAWIKYEGVEDKVIKAVESILQHEIDYIVSNSCPAIYRVDIKDVTLTGNNPLSGSWRKFKGAHSFHDKSKKEGKFDPVNIQTTIKKCDDFRRKRKAEDEEEAETARKLADITDRCTRKLLEEVEGFDPVNNDLHKIMLEKAIEEEQNWKPDDIQGTAPEDKNIDSAAAPAAVPTAADIAAYMETMSDGAKYKACGMNKDDIDLLLIEKEIEREDGQLDTISIHERKLLNRLDGKLGLYFNTDVEDQGEKSAEQHMDAFIKKVDTLLTGNLNKATDRVKAKLAGDKEEQDKAA